MRTISHPPPHNPTRPTRPRGSTDDDHRLIHLRPQLIADGVVTSYIRDISTRHRHEPSAKSLGELSATAEAA